MFLKRRTTIAGGAGLLLIALAAAGCGAGVASGPPKTASGKAATKMTPRRNPAIDFMFRMLCQRPDRGQPETMERVVSM